MLRMPQMSRVWSVSVESGLAVSVRRSVSARGLFALASGVVGLMLGIVVLFDQPVYAGCSYGELVCAACAESCCCEPNECCDSGEGGSEMCCHGCCMTVEDCGDPPNPPDENGQCPRVETCVPFNCADPCDPEAEVPCGDRCCEPGKDCCPETECEEGCQDPAECCHEVKRCKPACKSCHCADPCPDEDDDDNDPSGPGSGPPGSGGGGGCSGGSCQKKDAGGTETSIESVKIEFPLGRLEDGATAGALKIHTNWPSRAAFRSALRYTIKPAPAGVEVIYMDEAIRQIKTDEILVDVEDVDDPLDPSPAYEIRFYDSTAWGTGQKVACALSTDPCVDGYVTTGLPFARWKLYSPSQNTREVSLLELDPATGNTQIQRTYTYEDDPDYVWTLVYRDVPDQNTVLRTETLTRTYSGPYRTDNYVVDSGGGVTYESERVYQDLGWGPVLIWTSAGGGSASSNNTESRSYYADAPNQGTLATRWYADGSSVAYAYDFQGRLILEEHSYRDEGVQDFPYEQNMTQLFIKNYTDRHHTSDNGSVRTNQPRTVVEKIEGQVVSETRHAYFLEQVTGGVRLVEIDERCVDPTDNPATSCSETLTTRREYYPQTPFSPERLAKVVSPDGRVDTYTYDTVGYTPAADEPGTIAAEGSGYTRTTVTHEGPQGPVTRESTRRVSIRDKIGNEWLARNYVYNGTGYEELDWTVQLYDTRGRVEHIYRSNGTHVEYVQSDCCGLAAMIDEAGRRTEYTYDSLGRL